MSRPTMDPPFSSDCLSMSNSENASLADRFNITGAAIVVEIQCGLGGDVSLFTLKEYTEKQC